jgi:DNA uptake protein ComE-like DNA-binding protein
MTRVRQSIAALGPALVLALLDMQGTLVAQAGAQPAGAAQGKQQALVDPNVASEKELTAVAPITPAIAKVIVTKRPFATVVDFDNVLKEQKLTAEQIADVHRTIFVRLNLNSASDDEILAIPGIGKRMLHEFKEYRPYTSMEQFRREIGKYIDKDKREAELARLERYVFIK